MADDLLRAVVAAAAGRVSVSAEVAQRIAAHAAGADRDLEAIAVRLLISTETVANQQTPIKQKLGVSTPVELARPAIRHGVVEG